MTNMDEICLESDVVQSGVNDTEFRLPSNIVFTKAYLSIAVVLDVVCLTLFVLLKGRFARTRLRQTLLVLMSVIASVCEFTYPIQVLAGNSYPCFLTVVLPIMIIPFWGGSLVGELMMLLFLSRFSETSVKAIAAHGGDPSIDHEYTHRLGVVKSVRKMMSLLFLDSKPNQTQAELKEDLVYLRFLKSRRGVISIFSIFLLPFLVVALVLLSTDPIYTQCYNCSNTFVLMTTMIIMAVIIFIIGMTVWWRIRRLPDFWGLTNEAFYSICFALLALIGMLLTRFTWTTSYYTYSHIFMVTYGLVGVVIEQTVVQLFLGWRQERKYSKKVEPDVEMKSRQGSRRQITVDEILKDEVLVKSFEEHLADEFGLESLFFIKDVETWKFSFHDIAPTARRVRAKMMQRTFVQDEGMFTINISDKMKRSINLVLDNPESVVESSLFDEAENEIKKMLNTGTVLRFTEKLLVLPDPKANNRTAISSVTAAVTVSDNESH